ncbi:hypothetical protein [Brachyspira pilosicoli]|uniref:hypothetical protein n=1 Tax=Brachyspira pilosicoli TaxID=52584 RepID=UPI001CA4ED78|nr:hypothetical protein [Brachyspira pilosicoli]MBW5398027.1 hypothetical protein [Brachyspira pilosicoli]
MKIPIDYSLGGFELIKFEWDSTNVNIVVNIKNNAPIKMVLDDFECNLINSRDEKFAYCVSENIAIKSHSSASVNINVVFYNKETSNLISDFVNLKKSDFIIHVINGKLKLFSLLPINLSNRVKHLNILDIIKELMK